MQEDTQNNQNAPEVDEFEQLQQKCDEYLNNWKRAAADFANYKKAETERAGMLVSYAKEDIFLAILPVLDSIDLANKHSDILQNLGVLEVADWLGGFNQIKKQIEEFLKKEGIEEIKTLGQKFDPNTMEAVAEAESSDIGTTEGGDEGTIVEELQKGYIMNNKVIRPAKVKITK